MVTINIVMVIEEKNKVSLGYARTSRDEQNISNQLRKLRELGLEPSNIYGDEGVSSLTPAKKRNGFKHIFERVQNGEVDKLYIFEISRLGRTSIESLQLFIEIESYGTVIISLSNNETWTKITDIPGIRNIFSALFSWFAELERNSLVERTKLGIERAREEGKVIGRPERQPDKKEYLKWKTQGLKTAQIARVMQIPASTLYRWVERWDDEERVKKNREA